jgi:3-deoxy-D-manno-octulosonic-acid transferase
VHNVLEPATFGVPLLVPTIHFAEAIALVNMEACTAVNNQQELNEAFENLIRNEDIRHEKDICAALLQMKRRNTKESNLTNFIK